MRTLYYFYIDKLEVKLERRYTYSRDIGYCFDYNIASHFQLLCNSLIINVITTCTLTFCSVIRSDSTEDNWCQ